MVRTVTSLVKIFINQHRTHPVKNFLVSATDAASLGSPLTDCTAGIK